MSVGLTGATLAGCTESDDEGAFKIGVPIELSQGWEPHGNTVVNGAEIAAAQIEENGGLDGRDIEFVVRDNNVDPGTTLEVTRELIQQEDVDMIFGPISSSNRTAIQSEVEENEIPLLYPIQYEGSLADDYCSEWLLKTGPIPAQNIRPLVPWLMENHGDSFYLLGMDYLWPEGILSVVREGVEERGGTILEEEYVQIGTTDYSSIIPRIENQDPDVLVMVVTGGGPPAIQQEMHDRGVRDNWTEVGVAHGQITMQGAPEEAVDGVISSHSYIENRDNEQNDEFVSQFRDEYGEDANVNYLTGYSFTGMKLLEAAVESAGGTSSDDIISGFDGVSIDTVTGSVSMDVDQQISIGTTIAEYNADTRKYDPIETHDPITPEEFCDDI